MTKASENDRLSLRHLGRDRRGGARVTRSQVRATPAARRYAREKGMTLDEVYDLTNSARITERDVDVAIEKKRIMDKRVKREQGETARMEEATPVEPVLGDDAAVDVPENNEGDAATDAAPEQAETSAAKAVKADVTGEKQEETATLESEEEQAAHEAAPETTETTEKTEEKEENKEDAESDDEASEKASPETAQTPLKLDLTPEAPHHPAVSPLAQKLADEAGVDVTKITHGSGPNGRIVRFDVRRYIDEQAKEQAKEQANEKAADEAQESKAPDVSKKIEETEETPAEDTTAEVALEQKPDEQTTPQAVTDTLEPEAAQVEEEKNKEQEKEEVANAGQEKLEASDQDDTADVTADDAADDSEAVAAEPAETGQKAEKVKAKKPADPVDVITVRPITLSLTANATRLARMISPAQTDRSAADYLIAAAQKALAAHPAVGLNEDGKVSLITLSGTDGLVETPAFTETQSEDIARQRADYLMGIRCNRFDKKAFDGTSLAVMVLDGIEDVSGCAGSGRPVLFCGALKEAGGEAPGRFNMRISLSLARKSRNVAAAVAFLKAFKDAVERGEFEEEAL